MRAIRDVEGYFSDDEGWALNRVVAEFSRSAASFRVVEIGSYKGRSTVCIGLALQERGNGTCVSIDPHAPTGKPSYAKEHGTLDTSEEFSSNLTAAGVEGVVLPVRAVSSSARSRYDGDPIDVLFIDGSHDFDDVSEDVRLWTPLLRDDAIVAFNDPYAPGVNRAISDFLLKTSSVGIRRLTHVNNTLFVEISPATARRHVRFSLRLYLFVERTRFKLMKLAMKGALEAMRIVYVRASVAASDRSAVTIGDDSNGERGLLELRAM